MTDLKKNKIKVVQQTVNDKFIIKINQIRSKRQKSLVSNNVNVNQQKDNLPFIQLTKETIEMIDNIIAKVKKRMSDIVTFTQVEIAKKVKQFLTKSSKLSYQIKNYQWNYQKRYKKLFLYLRLGKERISEEENKKIIENKIYENVLNFQHDIFLQLSNQAKQLNRIKQELKNIDERSDKYPQMFKSTIQQAQRIIMTFSKVLQKQMVQLETDQYAFFILKGEFEIALK